MRGKVKSVKIIKYIDNLKYMEIETDRIGNLKIGDFISFNVKNNYGDMKYENGRKFCINAIKKIQNIIK